MGNFVTDVMNGLVVQSLGNAIGVQDMGRAYVANRGDLQVTARDAFFATALGNGDAMAARDGLIAFRGAMVGGGMMSDHYPHHHHHHHLHYARPQPMFDTVHGRFAHPMEEAYRLGIEEGASLGYVQGARDGYEQGRFEGSLPFRPMSRSFGDPWGLRHY